MHCQAAGRWGAASKALPVLRARPRHPKQPPQCTRNTRLLHFMAQASVHISHLHIPNSPAPVHVADAAVSESLTALG